VSHAAVPAAEGAVLIACWSAKGGVGTTVVASCLALELASRTPAGVVLADLAGDVPAALGLGEVDSPGLAGWLQAGTEVPADALARLEIDVVPGLTVLPRGPGRLPGERADVLATMWEQAARVVVADCGTRPAGARAALAAAAARSLLVTRPCYLALRHARVASPRPTGVVVVREPGRVLGRDDVEQVVGAPVVAEVEVDPSVARAVDAGLLATPRLPRALSRALRHAG
jgi:MinD-like ATPase involved in chromosome partitioning or flagellar assembly